MDEETKKRWLSKEPIISNTYKREGKKSDRVDWLKQRGYFQPDGTDIDDDGKRMTPDRVVAKGPGRKLE